MLAAVVHPANIQDRHGALGVLASTQRRHPSIRRVLADAAYQGEATEAAVAALGAWELEIVAKTPGIKHFVVLPKRWIVERTFAWIGRCRRLAKDYECRIRSAFTFFLLALIRVMLRRVARAQTRIQT